MRKIVTIAMFLLPLVEAHAAELQGTIKDSSGAPVASAVIHLQPNPLTVKTDANGSYRLTSLQQGTYTLRVTATNFNEAIYGPFELGQNETKKVDLALKPIAAVDFFDEPKFTVAGVTNYSYVGGHGSEPVKRSSEALVKATTSLTKDGPVVAEGYEKAGKPLEAVREYQKAAEHDPSENNLFNWGAELLNHGASDAANEVFSQGIRLFPRSSRMLLGSAVAFYAKGDYIDARQRFFEAADVDPNDPGPYLFLGKLQSREITESPGYLDRLARFARLRPDNTWANYYYGTALRSKELLEEAVALDPALAAAHFQLGVLHSDEGNLSSAIREYQKAIAADPELEQAHYRLAQAYRQTGQTSEAQHELEAFEKISKTVAQKLERERNDLKQFVVTLEPKK